MEHITQRIEATTGSGSRYCFVRNRRGQYVGIRTGPDGDACAAFYNGSNPQREMEIGKPINVRLAENGRPFLSTPLKTLAILPYCRELNK